MKYRRSNPDVVPRAMAPRPIDPLDWLVPLAVFFFTFAVYLLTVAPTISWRNGGIDSGELVTAIDLLGIPHPSGFPVYLLLGKLFTLVPVGEIAYRVNVMSAYFAALTAAALTIAGMRLIEWVFSDWTVGGRTRSGAQHVTAVTAAAAGALAFAFSPLVWSRATIAKEYTLHLALLCVGLTCLFHWRASRRTVWLIAFGFAIGLALGNHLTSLSLVPGAVAFVYITDRRVVALPRTMLLIAAAMVPGIASYAYLPLRAAQYPYLNWDNPVSASGFLAHLVGAAYHGSLAAGLQPLSIVERLLFALRIIPEQLGWLGLLAFLVGAWLVAQFDRASLSLGASFAGLNLAFAAIYPVRDSEVYLLPAYLVAALLIGLGVYHLAAMVAEMVGVVAMSRARLQAAGASGFLVVVTVVAIVSRYSLVDVSANFEARDYATTALRAAPPRAILLADRDEETFSLWYVQQVIGERQDVVIVDVRLLALPWYRASLGRLNPDLGLSATDTDVTAVVGPGHVPGRPVSIAPTPTGTSG